MKNPVVMPARAGLHNTARAVNSVLSQDVDGGVLLLVIDNGSEDGIGSWVRYRQSQDARVLYLRQSADASVAASWNRGLRWAFQIADHEKNCRCLVINNDVALRPDTYRRLLEDGGEFVTGVGNGDPGCILRNGTSHPEPDPDKRRPHPDFSCFLIRKTVWETVGAFDERYRRAFCEDNDYHVRMHMAGIEAHCIDLPFHHVGGGSNTLDLLSEKEAEEVRRQADLNRAYFHGKWGFEVGSPEYEAFFRTRFGSDVRE